MQFNLFEKFILLALDQKKGKFLIDTLSLNYGIAGAILLELSEMNKISIQNKKIIVTDKKLTKISIVDDCIKLINNSKKSRRAKYWINKIGNKSSGFKKIMLKDLRDKNIIKIDKKTYIWGLVKLFRYPVINPKQTEEIKFKLKKIVLKNEKSDIEGLLLLSLMNSCKLTRVLFPNRKEHRVANRKIKELTKSVEISDAASQTLKEIQSAVLVATASTFVGAS